MRSGEQRGVTLEGERPTLVVSDSISPASVFSCADAVELCHIGLRERQCGPRDVLAQVGDR